MATEFPKWQPIGGVNREQNENSLDPTEVFDSSNFLYENGQAFARPGVAMGVLSGIATGLIFAKSLRINSTPTNVLIGSDSKLYKEILRTCTQITGAGVTWGAANFQDAISFNGVVIFANSTGGFVRWDPAGTTYTVIAAAKYRYVTKQYSRIIGAYDTNQNALIGPRTIGWCVTGDETTWTGFGSGTSLLSDADDEITGMGTVQNVIVIARRTGFHLGFSTGVSNPAFRFEKWNDASVGCFYPETWTVDMGLCYFVGRDNVYTFDLQQLKPIGNKIRKDLLPIIGGGASYRGFVTQMGGVGNLGRRRYHLVPLDSTNPHFCLDIDSGVWSKHIYDPTVVVGRTWAFSRIVSDVIEGPTLVDGSNPPKYYTWNSTLACETAASMTSSDMNIGDLEKDYSISRIMMRARDYGLNTPGPTVTLAAQLKDNSGNSIDQSVAVQRATGSAGADGKWHRYWFDMRNVGQKFVINLLVAAGLKFAVDYFSLETAESGDYRE